MKKETIDQIRGILNSTQNGVTVNKLNLQGFSGDKLLFSLHSLAELLLNKIQFI